ncbi:uncharacterized protein G2W53_029237 [Senna tora]|uniref:Uncharacterized protein n=1 Tax=Senna tora TaxID=362788 RepID=A0A834WBM2_9FABA|nr:uncharacterized protein G2W53_029237 [Senna tora]
MAVVAVRINGHRTRKPKSEKTLLEAF